MDCPVVGVEDAESLVDDVADGDTPVDAAPVWATPEAADACPDAGGTLWISTMRTSPLAMMRRPAARGTAAGAGGGRLPGWPSARA